MLPFLPRKTINGKTFVTVTAQSDLKFTNQGWLSQIGKVKSGTSPAVWEKPRSKAKTATVKKPQKNRAPGVDPALFSDSGQLVDDDESRLSSKTKRLKLFENCNDMVKQNDRENEEDECSTMLGELMSNRNIGLSPF